MILYGYLREEKRYGLIGEHVLDSIQLVSVGYKSIELEKCLSLFKTRHISEAIVFEGSFSITVALSMTGRAKFKGIAGQSDVIGRTDLCLRSTWIQFQLSSRIRRSLEIDLDH